MSAAVELFNYSGQQVRVIVINDEPWFIAPDAARILDLRDTSSALKMVDDEEKQSLRRSDTPQFFDGIAPQVQMLTVVNESGMYALIFQSNKEQARKVRRWITGEVLPAIRKTGSYGTPRELTRMELIELAHNAESERLALESQNNELAPKAEAYDDFLDATGKYGVGAVAKMLGTSQNKLFRELRNRGVFISKGAMRNTPYQQHMHHFEVKAHEFERSNGEMGCSYTTYVQPSGIDFIRRKLDLPSIDPLPVNGGAA